MTDPVPSTIQQDLIARYVNGTSVAELAKERGVTDTRIYQILIDNNPEGWKSAQAAKAMGTLERAKRALDSADSGLELARAREVAKLAQWELERLLKRIYGPSQEVTGKDGGPIQVQVVRFGDTFEGDAAVHTPVLPAPGKDGGS